VRYFDSKMDRISAEHVIASGALPPAFPAVVIDGESYWDGGTVSNTPLDYVLSEQPRRDSLVLQVDLWSARGPLPATLLDVLERQKDIQYSSRTRFGTDTIARLQGLRGALTKLVKTLPDGKLPASIEADLQPWMCDRVFNIVHLIHQTASHEQQYKDFAFDTGSLRKHWESGGTDMRNSLENERYFELPSRDKGFVTHDIHRARIEAGS
jgi:NTE family protein